MKITTRFNATDDAAEAVTLNNAEAVCFSTRSPNKMTPNEDSLAIIPVNEETIVLVVADGLGGMAAGEQASKLVINCLVDALSTNVISVRDSILSGIDYANKQLIEKKHDTGTTVSVAEIKGNTLRTYHAGDSLILVSAGHGKPKYIALSHSPISYAVACGAIDAEKAMCHPERNLISNYVGCVDMHINIGPTLELSKFDSLILSSDAVSDNLYDGEICQHISKESLFEGTSDLIEDCKKNMREPCPDRVCHPDDFTLITYRLK